MWYISLSSSWLLQGIYRDYFPISVPAKEQFTNYILTAQHKYDSVADNCALTVHVIGWFAIGVFTWWPLMGMLHLDWWSGTRGCVLRVRDYRMSCGDKILRSGTWWWSRYWTLWRHTALHKKTIVYMNLFRRVSSPHFEVFAHYHEYWGWDWSQTWLIKSI